MNPSPDKQNAASATIDRWPYFWLGCTLIAIKYNLDRFIAWRWFDRSWYFWNYLQPHEIALVDTVPPHDATFYLALLVTSLPFLAAGLFLTLRRLRSAGLPLGLCLLFVVPVINLAFFIVLCLVPGQSSEKPIPSPDTRWWRPRSAVGSALMAIVLVGLAGAGLSCFSTEVLQAYGSALFVALPFVMGLVSVLIYGAGPKPPTVGNCLLVAVLPVFFCGLCLLACAAEGAICLIMAAPIALLLALMGGAVGYVIVGRRGAPVPPVAMLTLLLSVPLTMGMEQQADEDAPLLCVTSSVVIHASPERVWPNVVTFSPIPEARDWILHTGVAYPTRARIDGEGVGAVRHCIFTTGEFVEPIEVWDAPHLLRFSVAAQPEPMEELSPYPHLRTPHLHGCLQSREGELRLTNLAGGDTLLTGTTWYTDRIWPGRYWQIWSDLVIHHIHLRVLNHIKELSEQSVGEANSR